MAWQSRVVVNSVLKLGRQSTFSPSSFDTAFKTSLSSSQILAKKNNNSTNFQQIRYNSTVQAKLGALIDSLDLVTIITDKNVWFLAQKALCYLHDVTGLDGGSTIALSALVLQLCLGLPFAVIQYRSFARYENLAPEMKKLNLDSAREVLILRKCFSWSVTTACIEYQTRHEKRTKALMKKNRCIPWIIRSRPVVWTAFIGPVISITSWALGITKEAMAEQQYRFVQMMAENPAIFESFIDSHTFALPGIITLIGLLNFEVLKLRGLLTYGQYPIHRTLVVWISRLGIIGLGVTAMFLPSHVAVFLAAWNTCGLGKNLLLQVPAVRSFCRIPKTTSFEAQTLKRIDFLNRLRRLKLVPTFPATCFVILSLSYSLLSGGLLFTPLMYFS